MELNPPKNLEKNFVGDVLLCTLKEKIWSDEMVHYVSFRNGARTKFHSHLGPQVLVGVKGKGQVVITSQKDDGKGNSKDITIEKIIEINPGSSITIDENTIHCHGSIGNEEFVHIAINIFPPDCSDYTRWYELEKSNEKSLQKFIDEPWRKNSKMIIFRKNNTQTS